MGYYDPMPRLAEMVEGMAPALRKVTVGPPRGNEPTPFAIIRTVGSAAEDPQYLEAERTVSIVVFADSIKQANEVSNALHWQIRRRHLDNPQALDGEHTLPGLFSAGGHVDLVDPDRKLPGVARTYDLIFCEDDGM